jgi:putative ABC transport system permease protein
MPLWKIAWRSIQRRALASWLTTLSMALGVLLVVGVLVTLGVITESFRNNSSLGYNMIMGAKGGKLQLVLNTVYYLSQPVENIPYSFYQEFLDASARNDGRDGKWKDYVRRVVPVCLGDYYREFRVVGTTPQMFEVENPDDETQPLYRFAAGRNFKTWSDEYGFFEAVVGSRVARKYDLKIGDKIIPTHGSEEGEAHDTFFVVGILAPSGSANDRAVFINMEGFFLLEGHAKPVAQKWLDRFIQALLGWIKSLPRANASVEEPPSADSSDHRPATVETALAETPGDANGPPRSRPAHLRKTVPLPIEQREVTAMLVRTVSPFVSQGLANTINEGQVAQAVLPVLEITALFDTFVNPLKMALLVMTGMICLVSGIGILVSIYNSMADRHREIAIMRSLGANRRTVMVVVLLEAIILALGGGLLGWIGGHLTIAAASPRIESETGVQVGLLDFAPPVSVLRQSETAMKIERLTGEAGAKILDVLLSPEFLLIPTIIVLAILVGFLPAVTAYKTDVAKSLSANP